MQTNQNSIAITLFLLTLKRISIVMLLSTALYIPIYIGILQCQIIDSSSTQSFLLLSMYPIVRDGQLNITLFTNIFSVTQFECFTIVYDVGIQIIILISLFIVQNELNILAASSKEQYVENYALEITKDITTPFYITIVLLQQFLQNNLRTYKSIIFHSNPLDLIFDIQVSFHPEQIRYRSLLRHRLGQDYFQKWNNTKLKDMHLTIHHHELNPQIAPAHSIWIIFQTRFDRKLAFKILRQQCFSMQNHCLEVKKACNPSQVNSIHLYTSNLLKYAIRLLTATTTLVFIVVVDVLILYIDKRFYQQNPSNWFRYAKILFFIFLEAVIKHCIIFLSPLERYSQSSYEEKSLQKKLTFFYYLNTACLCLIGNYKYSAESRLSQISTMRFVQFDKNWYEEFAQYIFVVILVELLYKIFQNYINYFKHYILSLIQHLWGQRNLRSISENITQFISMQYSCKPELAFYYSNLISAIMIALTYSYFFPLLYPLLFVFTLASYYSSKHFITNYLQEISYSSNRLHTNAFKFLYFAILVHLFLQIFVNSIKTVWIVVLFFVLFGLYVFRYTIHQKICFVLEKIGFSTPIKSKQHSNQRLTQRLTKEQRKEKIKELKERKLIDEYVFLQSMQSHCHLHKIYFEKYQEIIDERIKRLEDETQQNSLFILGALSYFAVEQIL